MNISYLGNFHDAHSTEGQIARAFERLGHTVIRLGVRDHDHDSVVAAVKASQPEVLLGAKWGFRGADGAWPDAANPVAALIAECRPHVGKVVCLHWDCVNPEFSPARFTWQQIVSEACDLTALTDGSVASQLPRVIVLRDGAPDDVDLSCESAEKVNAACFTGTLYGRRQEWAAVMRARLGARFVHVGPGGDGYEPLGVPSNTEIRGPELTPLVRSFRLCVQPPWPAFDGYASDRVIVTRAHGGLLVSPELRGYGDDLEPWRHYITVPSEPRSYAAKVAELLDSYDAATLDRIRRNGEEHARARPWEVRCRKLIELLLELGVTS
ncbi:MAG: glycosyltransferase [Patescibacteria group bacterium]|nr:glycosyltransferase [Patescibacteria group bacterium]